MATISSTFSITPLADVRRRFLHLQELPDRNEIYDQLHTVKEAFRLLQ